MRVVHVIPKGLTHCYGSEVKADNGDHDFENLLKFACLHLTVWQTVLSDFFYFQITNAIQHYPEQCCYGEVEIPMRLNSDRIACSMCITWL